MTHASPPLAVLEPSRIWHRRAALFASAVLLLVVVAGFWVPHVLLLAPVTAYQLVYSLRFLQPGRVGIALYEDHLVVRYPFKNSVTLQREQLICFVPVFRAHTELVVARREAVDPRGADGQKLLHPSDVVLPAGLMRNPGLAGRLEAWRTGSFTTASLIPAPEQGSASAAGSSPRS